MARAMEESFFLRNATVGLSSIVRTSTGMDDLHAGVAQLAGVQGGLDFVLFADQVRAS